MSKDLQLKTAASEKIHRIDYFDIGVSVDCVIFGYEGKDLKVLIIRSDFKEFQNLNALPGDLVKPDEDLEAASYRVLKERTGLDDVYLEQVQAFGGITRHPAGRVITIAYFSLIDIKSHKLKLSHNELHWHSVKEIKKLAFDHKLILDTCLTRLKQQVMETPVVFNLLPEKFSLRELQELYQAILGVELDRRNFRKKLSLKDWLDDINEMETDVPHRPGKLFMLKSSFRKKISLVPTSSK